MKYHLHNPWLPGSGVIPFPAKRRRTQVNASLRRYMLEVYDYVACGLAVTGVAAHVVTASGFHAAMMDQTPAFVLPFVWILLLAPLGLVMLLWLSIDEMGSFSAHATAWACAVLTGFAFECISQLYTGVSLAPLSFVAAATFSAMSVYGYTMRADLSKSRHFVGMGVGSLVLASVVNFFLGSTAAEFALCIIGMIALVGLTACDTQRITEIFLDRDDGEATSKKAIVGALTLYLDANPVVLLLRLENLFTNERGE